MKKTGIFITAIFIIVGIYDLITVMINGVGCSVSQFMQESCFRSPLVNGCLFFILGHWLAYMPPKWKEPEKRIENLTKKFESFYLNAGYTKEQFLQLIKDC